MNKINIHNFFHNNNFIFYKNIKNGKYNFKIFT